MSGNGVCSVWPVGREFLATGRWKGYGTDGKDMTGFTCCAMDGFVMQRLVSSPLMDYFTNGLCEHGMLCHQVFFLVQSLLFSMCNSGEACKFISCGRLKFW